MIRQARRTVSVLALVTAPAAAQDIVIGDVRVVEGDATTQSAVFTVMLSAPATGAFTVSYATKDGGATAGTDYVASSGTVRFAKGDRMQVIAVIVNGDRTVEPDESFMVALSSPSSGTLVRATGIGTIVSDDAPAGGSAGPSKPGAPPPPSPPPTPIPPTLLPGRAVYEVRFTFTGYAGSYAGNDCPGVRPSGTAIMRGLLAGDERVGPDESVEYEGVLQLEVDLDLCEAKQVPGGDAYCTIGVAGAGPVDATFKISGDGRGAYINAWMGAPAGPAGIARLTGHPLLVKLTVNGALAVTTAGNCGSAANAAEAAAFPDNSAANALAGNEFNYPGSRLKLGTWTDGDIKLEVLRVVRP